MSATAQRTLTVGALVVALLVPVSVNAQTSVVNTAAASYGNGVGIDSVASNTVATSVVAPQLFIAKMLTGPSTAKSGDLVGDVGPAS